MSVIGTVWVRDFDRGVVTSLGSEIITFMVDGAMRSAYAVDVAGVKANLENFGDMVPVFFVMPDDVYQPFVYPSFVVRRTDLAPAFDRASWYGWVGRKPTDTAKKVVLDSGEEGYTEYTNQWRATPFDISYDVQYFARDREDSLWMMLHTMRRLKAPWWNTKVVDSLGDVRDYDTGEVSQTDSSELSEIDNRAISTTFSFLVRGELDLDDEVVYKSFTGASALDKDDPLYSDKDLILRLTQKQD